MSYVLVASQKNQYFPLQSLQIQLSAFQEKILLADTIFFLLLSLSGLSLMAPQPVSHITPPPTQSAFDSRL